MGYSFYLVSKDKPISETDFEIATSNLSAFNKTGFVGRFPCDVTLETQYIRVSGSFSMSGRYAEGFVLNLLICFMDLGYNLRVLSSDWNYGTAADWEFFDKLT